MHEDDPRLPAEGADDAGSQAAAEEEFVDAEGTEAEPDEAALADDEEDHLDDDADAAPVRQQAPGALARRRPPPPPVDIEARERAARAEGELAALRQQQSQPRPPSAADQAAEAERERNYLAGLSLEDRQQYLVNKGIAQVQGQMQAQTFQLQDQIDKTAFSSLARENQIARRLAPEVEQRLTAMRNQGINITREALLDKIIGERVRAGTLDLGKTRQAAAANRQRQQSNGRAPATLRRQSGLKPGSPEAEKAARNKRLENHPL